MRLTVYRRWSTGHTAAPVSWWSPAQVLTEGQDPCTYVNSILIIAARCRHRLLVTGVVRAVNQKNINVRFHLQSATNISTFYWYVVLSYELIVSVVNQLINQSIIIFNVA